MTIFVKIILTLWVICIAMFAVLVVSVVLGDSANLKFAEALEKIITVFLILLVVFSIPIATIKIWG